jgi:O-antigen/teichoic acid export membrane protein
MEKINKSKRTSGLAFDSIVMAFTKCLTILISLATTKCLSISLSLTDYGSYSEALIVLSIATSLSIFGFTDATMFFSNSKTGDFEKHKRYINTIFTLEMIVGFLFGVVICALAAPISSYFSNPSLFPLIFVIAFQPLFDNMFAMLQTLYISKGKAKAIALRNLIISSLRLCFVCVGCFVLHNILFILLLVFATSAIQFLIFLFWYKKIDYQINPFKLDQNLVKEILVFSIPMALYILVNSLLRESDKVFLGRFLSTDDMAIYSNAAKVLPFDLVVSALVTVTSPLITKLISNGNNEDGIKLLRDFLGLSFFATFILTAGAIANSRDLMLFLYDQKYLPGLYVFIVYIAADMMKFCNLSIVLMSKKRSIELTIMSAAALVLNIGLDFAFYYWIGPIGCAVATLIVTVIVNIFLVFRSSVLLGCSPKVFFYFKRSALLVVEGAAFGTGFYFLSQWMDSVTKIPMLNFLVCYTLFALILLLMNWKFIKQLYKSLNSFSYDSCDNIGELKNDETKM